MSFLKTRSKADMASRRRTNKGKLDAMESWMVVVRRREAGSWDSHVPVMSCHVPEIVVLVVL